MKPAAAEKQYDGPAPREASVRKGMAWLLGVTLPFALLVLALPLVAKRVPWSVESRFMKPTFFKPKQLCQMSTGETFPLLRRVVDRVFPLYPADRGIPLEVKVIRSSEVNALAFPAGQIYVFDGLLRQAESDAEIAAVIAHEIEHEKERHVMQGILRRFVSFLLGSPSLFDFLVSLQFSREQEREADRGALLRLRDANVSADGFRRFFEKQGEMHFVPTVISTHPPDYERARLAAEQDNRGTTPILSREDLAILKLACQ